ncbi:MAG TPA: hypothetical protein VK435_02615 [Thermodesulfovibrionales bacterium]|nr:hypothetical protein [Thermodesulfovibrionales bacterium]
MSIETVLLILESVLLAATIVLLLYSIREGKERRGLLLEVGKATKILTRQEYFLTVKDSMMDAQDEIVGFITGRPPTEDDRKRIKDIIHNIEQLTAKGIKVRYMMPKFHDRLQVGYLYTKAGAEIRFSACAIANNIRYIVIDSRAAVIGMPECMGEKEATRKGYRIPAEGLASILKDHFYGCWEESVPYSEYGKEIIEQTGASAKVLEKELHVDSGELERLASL